jgi:sigma-E factor negative regulatory protein RseB
MRFLAAVLCLACSLGAQAADEPAAWLASASAAARKLTYSGVFVFRQGQSMESAHVYHARDGQGEHERLVALGGPRREFVRHNDSMICYQSQGGAVKAERKPVRRFFPGILPEAIDALLLNYRAASGARERVAGRDCQVIALEPRDTLRYGHKLCVDAVTGLLLKAQALDARGDVIHEYAFTELSFADSLPREAFQSSLVAPGANPVAAPNLDASLSALPADGTPTWRVVPPPGFEKIKEMRRVLPGKPGPVTQITFSDGLSALSIFIEPAREDAMRGLTSQGSINIYVRRVSDHLVTATGEVPPAALMSTADSAQPGNR